MPVYHNFAYEGRLFHQANTDIERLIAQIDHLNTQIALLVNQIDDLRAENNDLRGENSIGERKAENEIETPQNEANRSHNEQIIHAHVETNAGNQPGENRTRQLPHNREQLLHELYLAFDQYRRGIILD